VCACLPALMRITAAPAFFANASRSTAFKVPFLSRRSLTSVSAQTNHITYTTTSPQLSGSFLPLLQSRVPPRSPLRSQYQALPVRPQLRYCSYQRNNMCKHFADAVSESATDVSKGRELLPKNVKPLHYHLTLEPNLETFEYKGKVVIESVPSG